jgi:hypothetical protein
VPIAGQAGSQNCQRRSALAAALAQRQPAGSSRQRVPRVRLRVAARGRLSQPLIAHASATPFRASARRRCRLRGGRTARRRASCAWRVTCPVSAPVAAAFA